MKISANSGKYNKIYFVKSEVVLHTRFSFVELQVLL